LRVLLDENLLIDLAAAFSEHAVEAVVGLGWAESRTVNSSGPPLALTRSSPWIVNSEFQHLLARQSFGNVVVYAPSSRIVHLIPLVPEIKAGPATT
jgi:hypothetical protein